MIMNMNSNRNPNHVFKIDAKTEEKINSILSKMTLDEKIGQMCQYRFVENERELREEQVREGKIGSLFGLISAEKVNEFQRIAVNESRLGIPLIFANDIIHGCVTSFPIPLAQASSWDLEIIEESEACAAREAASIGTQWVFAPMVDIARDPRWGRIAEGAGEDTFLGSEIAAARIRGFQRNGWSGSPRIVACPKHFAAYGNSEGGRDCNAVDVSEKTLREVYLPPFKATLEAGAASIMTGYHDLNGLPVSANDFLLNKILRDEWGFEGVALSDWQTIIDLEVYGVASNLKAAAEMAANCGQDMDMHSDGYMLHLAKLVREGKVCEKTVDEAVRRILRLKFFAGLFENPYTDTKWAEKNIKSRKVLDTALEMARKSIVLLKNENALLPLKKDIKSIAVIGPLADSRKDPLGTWNFMGDPDDVITVLDAIKQKIGGHTAVHYAKGCDIDGDSTEGIAEAVSAAKKSEVALVVLGESADMSGESNCRAFLGLPGQQEYLLKELYKSGTPVILVLMNGRPLSVQWAQDNVPSIVEAWHLGLQSGNAIGDVLFGDYNPGGKLPATFPRSAGQLPVYYNHRKIGGFRKVKYLDIPDTPLYPFGYGLSYTHFEYSNLTLDKKTMTPDQTLSISVDVKNTGKAVGEEVVQLYVYDVVASMTRPIKELKGFKRVKILPGEIVRVEFKLTREHLGFYNKDMKFTVEPGEFILWVGTNSAEGLEDRFEVK